MRKEDRKGVSPVIATVLLVGIALVLAVIVFLWASSFIGESIEKEGRAIELACENVKFEPEAISTSKIDIVNRGNVPIYGIEIRGASAGGEVLQFEKLEHTITSGETDTIDVASLGLSSGTNLLIVPVLLGETADYKKEHVCDTDYGETTTVP